jgi:hypothetical protein
MVEFFRCHEGSNKCCISSFESMEFLYQLVWDQVAEAERNVKGYRDMLDSEVLTEDDKLLQDAARVMLPNYELRLERLRALEKELTTMPVCDMIDAMVIEHRHRLERSWKARHRHY